MPETSCEVTPEPLHAAVRVLSGASALALAGSSVFMWVLLARDWDWFVGLFELVVSASAAVVAVAALGRFRAGPALALVCAGGSVFVSSVLTEPGIAGRLLSSRPALLSVGGFEVIRVMLPRIGVGAALIGLAMVAVWLRRPGRSWWYLWRSAAAFAPVAAVGVYAQRGAPGLSALPGVAAFFVWVLVFFVVVALISASGHCFIRSLEVGSGDARPGARPGAAGGTGGGSEPAGGDGATVRGVAAEGA